MNEKINIKQYIDYKLKAVQDAVNDFINGKDVKNINLLDSDDKFNDIVILEPNEEAEGDVSNKISASDIITDTTHRYITDKDMEKLKEAISSTELTAAIKEVTTNFKIALNEQMDNIINNKDSIDAINKIKEIINENQESIDLFKNLISKDELTKHENSGLHINSEDRIALNLLLKFIDKGCADWNAVEGDANYIRNKPNALPANGGNADTVGGMCAYKLMNKQLDKYIIGINTEDTYDLSAVNILLTKNNVKKMNKYFYNKTSVAIREGFYQPQELTIDKMILHGAGYYTNISDANINISSESIIRDISFSNCSIYINGSYISMNNVKFYNCNFVFADVKQIVIQNCRFEYCVFVAENMYNSIIKDNIFANGDLSYFGGNNIIKDNIKLEL